MPPRLSKEPNQKAKTQSDMLGQWWFTFCVGPHTVHVKSSAESDPHWPSTSLSLSASQTVTLRRQKKALKQIKPRKHLIVSVAFGSFLGVRRKGRM